ncbi:MAG: hypothetical protein GTN49_08870 [candidate division Zixibacteria bacterium]|nr:hypothetical protein [candidate division Zixibacteria bacterium]
MFEEVNRVREGEDLTPLEWDRGLTLAARQHSDEMKRLYYFSHESPTPGLRDVPDRVYAAGVTDVSMAENLASENSVPPSEDPEAVGRKLTELLLASENHRANILDRRFTHSGIGCAASEEGTLFCTQVFSKRTINFKSIRLKDEAADTLKVTLTLKTEDVVGVWLDETDTYVFMPDDGVVVVTLLFRLDDGRRKVVFARRKVDEYGAMKGFFIGTFDARKPYNFGAGITDVDVLAEEHVSGESKFYILEAEGKLLADAAGVKLADGDVRYAVKMKGKKFKVKYPILTGSGLHEVLFVIGDRASHGLKVDADRPLAEAFRQTAHAE